MSKRYLIEAFMDAEGRNHRYWSDGAIEIDGANGEGAARTTPAETEIVQQPSTIVRLLRAALPRSFT